jgi:fatty-acyl-CoA synthase
MMQSTMQDWSLTVTAIFKHGARVYSDSEVVTFMGDSSRRASFAGVARRVERLASALKRLGVKQGDCVGTFCWSTQEHQEAYLAVPSMGAVLHALNIRLFPEQLAYVINHAEDRFIIVDESLAPLLARVKDQLKTVKQFIVIGDGDASALGQDVLRYEELIAAENDGFDWPDVDERAAAAVCYTSGTTGNPKGVVYSHRSEFLHSMSANTASLIGLTDRDRVLPIAPMFHANAWGMPFSAWMSGADLIMPGKFLQGEPLCRLIETERPTVACAVPTVWSDVLRYAETRKVDFSSIRIVLCGGAAIPRPMVERFQKEHGVAIRQGWGMTETSPIAAVSQKPKNDEGIDELTWLCKSGRVVLGVEMRLMDGDEELAWDGQSVGEIQVRGAWVTDSYHDDDSSNEKFQDGWLRTGDVGYMDHKGYVQLTDRSKDVIKSGGEWISSVELENALMSHPSVLEAAVISVPDERWDERPLACVVLKEGASATVEELREFLSNKVAKWWLPERWTFIKEIPKTSVGKFDKKVLRAKREAGELEIITIESGGVASSNKTAK